MSTKVTKMNEFISVKEFAELFGADEKNIYRLIEKNEIPHYRIGRLIRLRVEDFRKENGNV